MVGAPLHLKPAVRLLGPELCALTLFAAHLPCWDCARPAGGLVLGGGAAGFHPALLGQPTPDQKLAAFQDTFVPRLGHVPCQCTCSCRQPIDPPCPGPLIVCSLGGRTPGIICCPVTRVSDSRMSSPRERNQPLGLVAPGVHLDCEFCCERSAGPGASIFSPDCVFNRCSPRVCCHPLLSHHCPCLDSGRSLQMASPLALIPLRSGP